MRPKLKGDALYMPVPNGVCLRNNQNTLTIQGKVVHQWLESLAPFLDGHATLEELTRGLEPEKQAMVTDLVGLLLANHFLKDVSGDLPHTLSPAELDAYAPEIAFIDSFCDSAAYRFERFREQRLLLIGSGLPLGALVQAAVKSGVRQLAVLPTEKGVGEVRGARDDLAFAQRRDPRQTLSEVAAPNWDDQDEVLALLQPFDVILHVSDRPVLARARLLNRLCTTAQKLCLQAVFVEDRVWVGPLLRPQPQTPQTPGCWECAWRRLQGNLDQSQEPFPRYAFEDQQDVVDSSALGVPATAMVTHLMLFEVLKALTEAGPLETADGLIELDLETLQSRPHAFLPHPLCEACQAPATRTEAAFQAAIRHLEEGEPLDPDLFSRRAAPCFEQRLGLFRSLDEADFEQVPLHICQAIVSQPLPAETGSDPLAVIGVGAGFPLARRRATTRACEIYAASLVDRRLLLSEHARRSQRTPVAVEAHRFLTDPPLTSVQEWAWAIDLHRSQPCLAPAPLVYPVLRGLSPLGSAGRGIASGMSWAEAVSQALLALCQHLTTAQFVDALVPYRQVDLAAIALKPERKIQRYMYETVANIARIYDVTGPLQVPTFACCMGEHTLFYTSHFDAIQALQHALEQFAQHQQAQKRAQQLEYGLSPVPDLPPAFRGDTRCVPDYSLPETWPERQAWILQRLLESGWHAFAAPLDHDPVLTGILPYIVHVLLAHAIVPAWGNKNTRDESATYSGVQKY